MLCVSISACATSRDPEMAMRPGVIADPLEPVNRFIFGFNNMLDQAIIEPVARAYRFILPEPVRDSVQNFMRNLREPVIAANNLLQGDLSGTGKGIARFGINTTVGIAGLFDVAGWTGLEFEQEDFGQTMAVWGIGNGFYFVIPVLGPSSLRDGIGMTADAFADPLRIYTFNVDKEWIYYTRNGVEAVDIRARLIDAIEDMRKNSLDYYAAAKSVYEQKRLSLINDEETGGTGASGGGDVDFDSYDDFEDFDDYDDFEDYDDEDDGSY